MLFAIFLLVIVGPWALRPAGAIPTRQIVSLSGFYDTTPSRHPLTFNDIHGTYSRFMELSEKGNLCPRVIKHLTNGVHSAKGMTMPHKDIRQDGATCMNNGNLSLDYKSKLTSEEVDQLFGISPKASGFEKAIRNVLLSINGFYIGVEHVIRSCGDSSFAPDTTVLITSDSDPFGQHFSIPFYGHPKILLVKYGQTACAYTSSWASPEPISVQPADTKGSPEPVAVEAKPSPHSKATQASKDSTSSSSATPSTTPSIIVASQSPSPIFSISPGASPSPTRSSSNSDPKVPETKELPEKPGDSQTQDSSTSYSQVPHTSESVSSSSTASKSPTTSSASASPSRSVAPSASPSTSVAPSASPSASVAPTASPSSSVALPSEYPSTSVVYPGEPLSSSVAPTNAAASSSAAISSPSPSPSYLVAPSNEAPSPSATKSLTNAPSSSPSVSTTAQSHGGTHGHKNSATDVFSPDAAAPKKQVHHGTKGGTSSADLKHEQTSAVKSSSSPSASASVSSKMRDASSVFTLPGVTVPEVLPNTKGTPRASIYPDASKAPKIVDFAPATSPPPGKQPLSGLLNMFTSPSKTPKEDQQIDLGMKPKPSENPNIILRITPSPSAKATGGFHASVVQESPTALPAIVNPDTLFRQSPKPSPFGKPPLIFTNSEKTPSPSRRPMKESEVFPSPMAVIGNPQKSSAPSPQNPVPAEENDDGSACFPASASVAQIDGKRIAMEKLAVGDYVLVGYGQYSRVIDFSHADRNAVTLFDRFFTESGQILTVTPSHYIYTRRGLLPASLVTANDNLVLADGGHVSVIAKDQVLDRGLFNPHTRQGDIVVDGFLVSTYTSAVKPVSAHALMAPIRLLDTLGIRPTLLNSLVQNPMMIRYLNIRSS